MIEYIKLAICFTAGVYLYDRISIPILSIFMISIILVLTIKAIFKRKYDTKIFLATLSFVLGTSLCGATMNSELSDLYKYEERYVTAIGRVSELPTETNEKNMRYVLDVRNVNSEKIHEKILLTTDKRLKYGETVTASGFVESISEKMNRNGFDYQKHYRQYGVVYKLYCENVKVCDEKIKDYSPYALSNSIKNYISETIDEHYTGDGNAILKSVILGNKKEFTEEFDLILEKTGAKRYFYSAYLHIMLMLTLAAVILGAFGRNTRYSIMILMLAIYALVGAVNASGIRIAVMLAVAFFVRMKCGMRYYPDIIGITVLIVGIFNPVILFNSGFAMSVLSVIMIYYFYDYVSEKMKIIKNGYVRRTFSLGLICTIGMLPMSAYFYGTVSIQSILMSLLIMPCTAILVILSPILVIMLAAVGTAPLISQIALCVMYVMKLIPTVAYKIGLTVTNVAKPNALLLIIYLFLIVSAVKYIKKKRKDMVIALFCVASLTCSYLICEISRVNTIEITYINVGQGDGTLISSPYRFNVLIDGGGGNNYSDYNPGETLFLEYLEEEGITKIDSAFVSHYHQDHVQGIIAAMEQLKVRNLFLPDNLEDSEWRAKLVETANANGTKIHYISEETLLTYKNGMTIRIIPPVPKTRISEDENDTTYLYYVEYAGVNSAFTGDMTVFSERNMLDSGKAREADLLKVSHHGSTTATCKEWVEATKPKYSIISVGENNGYGLPNEEILKRLSDSTIYRTDRNGGVRFVIHKNGKIEVDNK